VYDERRRETRRTAGSEHETRDVPGKKVTIYHPCILGAGGNVSKATSGVGIRGRFRWSLLKFATECTTFEEGKPRFMHVFFSAEERSTTTQRLSLRVVSSC
jgi:hypothetical protein